MLLRMIGSSQYKNLCSKSSITKEVAPFELIVAGKRGSAQKPVSKSDPWKSRFQPAETQSPNILSLGFDTVCKRLL